MAIVSIASKNYARGTYGPYPIDNFLSADTDWLEVRFTVENWPTATPLITGQLLWGTGDGVGFSINSPPKDRNGNLSSVVKVRIGVPQTAGGQAAVAAGSVTMTAHARLTTAITLETFSDTPA